MVYKFINQQASLGGPMMYFGSWILLSILFFELFWGDYTSKKSHWIPKTYFEITRDFSSTRSSKPVPLL